MKRSRENEAGSSGQNPITDEDFKQLTRIKSAPDDRLRKLFNGKDRLPVSISPMKMLMGREFNYSGKGRFSASDYCHILSRYLPVHVPSMIDQMASPVRISRFSSDGSLFLVAEQKARMRIFDVNSGWRVLKDIQPAFCRQPIIDTSLSSDNRLLVYSSLSRNIGLLDLTVNTTERYEELEVNLSESSTEGGPEFDIISVNFSNDARQIVAAGSRKTIYVSDVETRRCCLRIRSAHWENINAVRYADMSGNIIYSGSEDCICKIWDLRLPPTKNDVVGCLIGHARGIISINSRGDGRYFISNGRDSALKLWDIRKMIRTTEPLPPIIRRCPWDPRRFVFIDLSLATFTGHDVSPLFVQCYFSPEHSTGQQYVYTGSMDGYVYIYDVLSRKQIAKLDHNDYPVCDCSWHPFYPMLVSSTIFGGIVKWEFPSTGEKPVLVKNNLD